MTIQEALTVREGDYVNNKPTGRTKLRVTKTWRNANGTIVMFRVNALSGGDWLHSDAFEKWVDPAKQTVPA